MKQNDGPSVVRVHAGQGANIISDFQSLFSCLRSESTWGKETLSTASTLWTQWVSLTKNKHKQTEKKHTQTSVTRLRLLYQESQPFICFLMHQTVWLYVQCVLNTADFMTVPVKISELSNSVKSDKITKIFQWGTKWILFKKLFCIL